MAQASVMDRAVLLLINGMSVEDVQRWCENAGNSIEAAKQIVADARKRITVAADYARDEQLGRAVMRLNDLYAKCIGAQDVKTALQTQRELNRLLGLYGGQTEGKHEEGAGDAELRRQVGLIESYLLPLNLAAEFYPIEEHARIAAEIIRSNGLAEVRATQGEGEGAKQ